MRSGGGTRPTATAPRGLHPKRKAAPRSRARIGTVAAGSSAGGVGLHASLSQVLVGIGRALRDHS
eukprot:2330160-Alexandrium_andersonii.AAC.1